MVEHMHALRVEEHAARRVAEERVVRPTVPKPGHHVEELAGAAIARSVLPVLVAAEIPRLHRIAGGDEVPTGAAAADVVQRGELPRDVVGLVVGGGGGGDQPEPLRHHRQRRQQGERVEGGDGGAALQRLDRHVQHGQVVGHEERVEAALLQPTREAHQMLEVEIGVREGAGVAPGRGVDAHGAHERAEPHSPWCLQHHRSSPRRR